MSGWEEIHSPPWLEFRRPLPSPASGKYFRFASTCASTSEWPERKTIPVPVQRSKKEKNLTPLMMLTKLLRERDSKLENVHPSYVTCGGVSGSSQNDFSSIRSGPERKKNETSKGWIGEKKNSPRIFVSEASKRWWWSHGSRFHVTLFKDSKISFLKRSLFSPFANRCFCQKFFPFSEKNLQSIW